MIAQNAAVLQVIQGRVLVKIRPLLSTQPPEWKSEKTSLHNRSWKGL